MKPTYKSNDVGGCLPVDLHKKAIEYARETSGISRPVKEHKIYIDAYRQCFVDMKELGMLKEEYQNGTPEKSSY